MPSYDYVCQTCGGTTTVQREMGEDREPTCCGQIMSRIWTATPVHFKTGGFYKTGG